MTAKILAVVSPKGGVGKTTVSVNLAAAIASMGKKVLLVDTNLETSHVAVYCSLVGFKYSLEDVLNGLVPVKDAIYRTDESNLDILPSRVFKERGDAIAKYKLINMFHHLKRIGENYDFIVLDSRPSSNIDFIKLIEGVYMVVVSAPEIASMLEAGKLEEDGLNSAISIEGLVLNRVNPKVKGTMSDKEIRKIVSFERVWKIPEDSGVIDALRHGIPMVFYNRKSQSAKAFLRLAQDIVSH
ncbi:MAG: MinD/ParA family protein [Candidatus Parvarchaeota archaeon]|nr:MinD/ParA family protein [Candidatus Parvarchaeota archaeon]